MGYINLLELFYPVGSVYMSASDDSPSEIIGGVWLKINNDTMLGAGNGYAGSHSITVNNMPNHLHGMRMQWGGTTGNVKLPYMFDSTNHSLAVDQGDERHTYSNGGGTDYTPYYYGVNIWVRTS